MTIKSHSAIAISALLSSLAFQSVQAEDRSSLGLLWENDTTLDQFGGRYTDRHFTAGVGLNYMHRDNDPTGNDHGFLLSSKIMRSLWSFGMDIESTRGGFSLGYQLYTPEDIGDARFYTGVGTSFDANELQVDDRPYAGYLFVEPKWERRGRSGLFSARSIPTRDRFSLSIGLVGPGAGGETLQNEFHSLFDDGLPVVGWHHQLDNEFTLNLHAERSWLFAHDLGGSGLSLDVMPTLGLDLGNVSTRFTLGTEFRLGLGQIHDFLIPSMNDSRGYGGLYLFGSAEGWAVAQNIFLDGNTFTDSHRVDKRNFVGEVSLGLGWKSERLEGQIAWVRRSVEFDLQDVPNSYLSLSASVHF